MNKTNKIILIILLLIAIVVLFIFLNNKYREAEAIIPVNIENKWQTYQNHDLGFEIKYPSIMANYNAICELKNGVYQSMFGMVPVKIFEDNNAIYISHEYFYKESDNICEKIDNSPEKLKNNPTWIITVQDIYNEEELASFIKNNFGDGCYVAEKIITGQDGVFRINITGDEGVGLDTNCPINYAFVLNYYPEKNKMAFWELGQEANFWGDEKGEITYDKEMVDSFKFIDLPR